MTSSPPDQSSQNQANLATIFRKASIPLLIVLTLSILAFSVYLAIQASSLETAPSSPLPLTFSTKTSTPLPTSTSTATLTDTPRPSFTPEPTSSPTVTLSPTATLTPSLIPSLTPAFPLSENDQYHLTDWTPELADHLINLLEAYPESLSAFARGDNNAGYFAAFQYAIQAQREALLRFPTAPQAENWLWGLAYNLARTGDPQAGTRFATLITRELNRGSVLLNDLQSWGTQLRNPILIETFPISSAPGLLSNSLIKVSGVESGSAFFWMLETPTGFESYSLTSDFDFLHPTVVNHFIADLNNDGGLDVAIYRSPQPGTTTPPLPRIFSLASQPPVELFFAPHQAPEVATDFRNYWESIQDGGSSGNLQFAVTIFPPCPVNIRHVYFWNGNAFEFQGADYQVNPAPLLLSFCELVIEHASRVWGQEITINLMETLLPLWPPETTPDGAPYPQDALDEWRFRLGLYYTLEGNYSRGMEYFDSLLSNPSSADSRWIAYTQSFSENYGSQRDIYQLCLAAPFCDPGIALKSLAATFSIEDYASDLEIFESAGVTIRSSGFFDFNKDGTTERWLIFRHRPTEKSQFWILVRVANGVDIILVDTVETNQPRITYADLDQDPPIVKIAPSLTFTLHLPENGQASFIQHATPEVVFSAGVTQQRLDEIETGLLEEINPARLRDDLVRLKKSSTFTCDFINCPRFYYLLGFANELAGEERGAVDAYLELWRNYSRHPLNTIARLKLKGLTLPPTPTVTASPTITLTPTLSGTLATLTPTTSGTAGIPTATPSLTLTPEGYP